MNKEIKTLFWSLYFFLGQAVAAFSAITLAVIVCALGYWGFKYAEWLFQVLVP